MDEDPLLSFVTPVKQYSPKTNPKVKSKSTSQFSWSWPAQRAAYLIAMGEHSIKEIAAIVNVPEHRIQGWRRHIKFQEQVDAHISAHKESMVAEGIALRSRRIEALKDRESRLQQIMEARSAYAAKLIEKVRETDPEHADFLYGQGITSGLVVKKKRVIGTGRNAQEVEEFEVDRSLWEAFLAHEKQIAQETGQWVERKEHSGDVDVKITIDSLRAALHKPRPQIIEGEVISVAEQTMPALPASSGSD